jgi:hypothetical protein
MHSTRWRTRSFSSGIQNQSVGHCIPWQTNLGHRTCLCSLGILEWMLRTGAHGYHEPTRSCPRGKSRRLSICLVCCVRRSWRRWRLGRERLDREYLGVLLGSGMSKSHVAQCFWNRCQLEDSNNVAVFSAGRCQWILCAATCSIHGRRCMLLCDNDLRFGTHVGRDEYMGGSRHPRF